jgi:hypothetical protein
MKHSIVAAALVTALAVVGSLVLVGCSPSTTKLAHGYQLERFDENGKYYVHAPNDMASGGGVFEGTVEELGWDDSWLIARVQKLYGGDTNGWYALNFKTKEILGPLDSSALSKDKRFSTIKPKDCAAILPAR